MWTVSKTGGLLSCRKLNDQGPCLCTQHDPKPTQGLPKRGQMLDPTLRDPLHEATKLTRDKGPTWPLSEPTYSRDRTRRGRCPGGTSRSSSLKHPVSLTGGALRRGPLYPTQRDLPKHWGLKTDTPVALVTPSQSQLQKAAGAHPHPDSGPLDLLGARGFHALGPLSSLIEDLGGKSEGWERTGQVLRFDLTWGSTSPGWAARVRCVQRVKRALIAASWAAKRRK